MNLITINPKAITDLIPRDADEVVSVYLEEQGFENQPITDVHRLAFHRLLDTNPQSVPSDYHGNQMLTQALLSEKEEGWLRLFDDASDWAEFISHYACFKSFSIVILGLEELGFDGSHDIFNTSTSDVLRRAYGMGLHTCPVSTVSAFKLSGLSLPKGTMLTLVSDDVCAGGENSQFVLERAQEGDTTYISRIPSLTSDMLFQGYFRLKKSRELPSACKLAFAFGISERERDHFMRIAQSSQDSVGAHVTTIGDLVRGCFLGRKDLGAFVSARA